MSTDDMQSLFAIINTLQKEYNVNAWQVNGLKIWPLIRTLIVSKSCMIILNQQTQTLGALCRGINLGQICFDYVCARIKDHVHRYREKETVDAVFLTNTGCRRWVKDTWIDVISDPVAELFHKNGLKTCALEYVYPQTTYLYPRYYPSRYIQATILLARIRAKIYSRFLKINGEYISIVNRLFGGNIISIDDLKYSVALILCAKEVFLSLYRELNPKFVFDTYWYNEISMGSILACKRLGIVSLSLPHGNTPDILFADWQSNFELLPDVFLYRMRKETNLFSMPAAIFLGNPWLETWFDDEKDYVLYYDQLIQKILPREKIAVLLSLDYTPVPEIIKSAMAQSRDNIFWFVRVHPGDIHNLNYRKAELKDFDNVEIDCSSNWPLEAWLRNVQVHVTEQSSVIQEAEQFGVLSVMLDSKVSSAFQREIDIGVATLVSTEEQMLKEIQRIAVQPKNRRSKVNPHFIEELMEVYKQKYNP